MHFHTGTHVVAQLFGMSVNLDTIFTQWLTALIVFIIVFAASRGRSLVPNGIQNAVEMVIEPLCSQFERNMGSHYKKVVYFLLTLFLFIFVANEIGLLPTAHLTASPTNDVNTTLGLALTGTLCIHFVYIRNRGFGKWLKHFFEPMPPFVIINIVEEPELNLFPNSQRQVLFSLIEDNNSSEDNMLLITTHSPYTLAVFNMAMLAAKVMSKTDKVDSREVENIIPEKYQVSLSDVAAYSLSVLEENNCRSILGVETGLISANDLDSVSEDISDKFSLLYNLYANVFHK